MIDFLIDNWSILVAIVCMICCVLETLLVFIAEPNEKKIANVREWLLYAVVEAEKALGSGTGAIKLRLVYDMAVTKFPWLPKIVDFNTFAEWVDEALIYMKMQLNSNKAVKEYIEG